MTPERLSRLQRRILAWLAAEEQRTRGTMAASHQDLVRALVALGFDKGNVSTWTSSSRRTNMSGVDRRGNCFPPKLIDISSLLWGSD